MGEKSTFGDTGGTSGKLDHSSVLGVDCNRRDLCFRAAGNELGKLVPAFI